MAGGKSTPKKDRGLKVSSGQLVTAGQILVRSSACYQAGTNVKGLNTLHALISGEVYFTKKKTPGGKIKTVVNIKPQNASSEN